MGSSVSFERAAATYDETRGGLRRGRSYARELDRHLTPGSSVLEIGVGTGLVAGPLSELGHRVVGLDLSRAMLELAVPRTSALVEADGSVLPVASHCLDAVVAVWAVHVVGDFAALAGEIARVLRPGGGLLHVAATPDVNPNDLHELSFRLGPALGRVWDRSDRLAPMLAPFGFGFEGDTGLDDEPFDRTPNEQAERLERRESSSLWSLDNKTWQSVVQPIIDGLRALPEPDRARSCRHTHLLSRYRLGVEVRRSDFVT